MTTNLLAQTLGVHVREMKVQSDGLRFHGNGQMFECELATVTFRMICLTDMGLIDRIDKFMRAAGHAVSDQNLYFDDVLSF